MILYVVYLFFFISNKVEWTLVGMNKAVNKQVHALKDEFSKGYEMMEKHLESTPTQGITGTLKQTVLNTRVWQYKLPSGHRVLYTLNAKERLVIIGYAGAHLNKHCTDTIINQLGKLC